MKRILAVLLAILLFSGFSNPAMVEATISDDVLFDLKTYGILQQEVDEIAYDQPVTRGEFSAMVVKLFSLSGYYIDQNIAFSDVGADTQYGNEILILATLGIVGGNGNGEFMPENNIALNEIIKILCSCLGYTNLAEQEGGYPNGYYVAAEKCGLLSHVSAGDPVSREMILNILYNCLDARFMKREIGQENRYYISDETPRDLLISADTDTELLKIEGIVTATGKSWLDTKPFVSLKEEVLYIDGERFVCKLPEAEQFFGQKVKAYIQEIDGAWEIISIMATNENTVIEILADDFIGCENGVVQYMFEGKERKMKVSPTASFLKNMRIVEEYAFDDITLKQGSMVLVDNNADGQAEIIAIEEFDSYIVSSTTEDIIRFKQLPSGGALTYIDFSDDMETDYTILNDQGEMCEISAIQIGDSLDVICSPDGELCKIIINPSAIVGNVTQIADTEITVDGEVYTLAEGFKPDIMIGETMKVYFNHWNDVYYLEEAEAEDNIYQYAYFADLKPVDSFGTQFFIKAVLPGDFVETEEKSEIEDDASVLLKLKGQNSAVMNLKTSAYVNVDGKRVDDLKTVFFDANGDRINRIVKYSLNQNGEINRILTVEPYGTEVIQDGSSNDLDAVQVYNANEKVFGGKNNGAFGVDERTKVLMLPNYYKQPAVSDEDFLATIELNNGQAYTVNGYDVREENEIVRLITITSVLDYEAIKGITLNSKLSVVTKVSSIIDEKNEIVTKVEFWSEGQQKAYLLEDDLTNINLAAGDIFYYALSISSNRISQILKIENIKNPQKATGVYGSALDMDPLSSGQLIYGYVKNIELNKIDDLLNRRVDLITVEFDNGESTVIKRNCRNAPYTYIYDERTNRITIADSVEISEGDEIMINIRNNTVMGAAMIRR